jgi:hypothetical protein
VTVQESFAEMRRKLKLKYFAEIVKVDNEPRVMAAHSYASFLNNWKLNPDNYVLFFKAMEMPNRYVIDALTEGRDPEHYFDDVAPTHGIIHLVFTYFVINKKGAIYETVLTILLGFLERVYHQPKEGYDLYAPTIEEVNHLSKFLDESKPHSYVHNRLILDILKHLNALDIPKKEGPMYEMAMQAGKIRTNFLDTTRTLLKILPPLILKVDEDFSDGIAPPYVYKD